MILLLRVRVTNSWKMLHRKRFMEKIRCWFFWLKVEWFNSSFWATYLCTPAKLSLLCTPFDTVMLVNKISRFHVKFFDCIATGEERIRDTFPDSIYRTPIRESFSFSTNSKNECSIVRYISLKIQNRRGIFHVHLPKTLISFPCP